MKTILTATITRKALILAFLIASFVFLTNTGEFKPVALAAICCSDCEVPPPGDGEEDVYCKNLCGSATDRSCISECRERIYRCWATCNSSC